MYNVEPSCGLIFGGILRGHHGLQHHPGGPDLSHAPPGILERPQRAAAAPGTSGDSAEFAVPWGNSWDPW